MQMVKVRQWANSHSLIAANSWPGQLLNLWSHLMTVQ